MSRRADASAPGAETYSCRREEKHTAQPNAECLQTAEQPCQNPRKNQKSPSSHSPVWPLLPKRRGCRTAPMCKRIIFRRYAMPLYVICPFFLYEKKTTLGCEFKQLRFPTYGDKKTWMMNNCCTFDYEYCAFAKMLTDKYYSQEEREH